MATLKDVAQAASVSIATASHVLNGTKRVTREVEQRVRDAMRELGYCRNRNAVTLRTGASRTIGVLVPDLVNPYFAELAASATRSARKLGYATLLFDSTECCEQEADGIRLMKEHGVDGLLWIPTNGADTHLMDSSVLPSMPTVSVDRPIFDYGSVASDHKRGGKLIAEYVHSLGHRKVGLLSGPQTIEAARLRRDAFLEDASGLDIVWEHEVPYSLTLLGEAAASLLRKNGVTMIVAGNDIIAIAALQVLVSAGFAVPDDVSIIGFDDIAWASYMQPGLTTVKQPTNLMAKRAIERIVELVDGTADTQPRHELYDVKIIERETTARLLQPMAFMGSGDKDFSG